MLMKLAMGIMSQFDDQFCFLLLKDVSVPERYLLKEIFRSGFFASILLGGIAKSVSSTDRKVTKLPSFFFQKPFLCDLGNPLKFRSVKRSFSWKFCPQSLDDMNGYAPGAQSFSMKKTTNIKSMRISRRCGHNIWKSMKHLHWKRKITSQFLLDYSRHRNFEKILVGEGGWVCLGQIQCPFFIERSSDSTPTVDDWNPVNSPVEVGSLSHYLQGFSTIPGGDRRISEPSTVGTSES